MKIVRLLSFACALCLLAACGSNSVTAPDTDLRSDAPSHNMEGGGMFGSGN